MKSRRERLVRRYPYGFGMGAFVATARGARRGPLTWRYGAMQARALVSGARSGSPRRALEPLLSTAGFAAGFLAATAASRRAEPRRVTLLEATRADAEDP
jgi:hypothetical protein